LSIKEEFLALGVSPDLAEELSRHFGSVSILAMASPSEVAESCGIGKKSAEKLVQQARRSFPAASPMTAEEMLQRSASQYRLTTGSKSLDEVLGGGIQPGVITELSGAFGTGKTQIAFQLCVNVQLAPEEGGLGGGAYYIDSEGTFAPNRVAEIITRRYGPDRLQPMLQKIYVSRAFNAEHQVSLAKQADRLIKNEGIKLVVVDSVASHFRAEFTGKEQMPLRQQILMAHAETLQRVAEGYNIPVLITNQVLINPDSFLSGPSLEPALGYAWGHRPTHRLLLRKSRGTARIARVFDSPDQPEREAVFHITGRGIEDQPGEGF